MLRTSAGGMLRHAPRILARSHIAVRMRAGAASADAEGTSPSNSNSSTLLFDGIPRSYDALELSELVRPFGSIARVSVLYFTDSGASKGRAFVEMSSPDMATEAYEGLANGKRVIDGSEIKVERVADFDFSA